MTALSKELCICEYKYWSGGSKFKVMEWHRNVQFMWNNTTKNLICWSVKSHLTSLSFWEFLLTHSVTSTCQSYEINCDTFIKWKKWNHGRDDEQPVSYIHVRNTSHKRFFPVTKDVAAYACVFSFPNWDFGKKTFPPLSLVPPAAIVRNWKH